MGFNFTQVPRPETPSSRASDGSDAEAKRKSEHAARESAKAEVVHFPAEIQLSRGKSIETQIGTANFFDRVTPIP